MRGTSLRGTSLRGADACPSARPAS
ncbi:MAG: hypothetical protein ABW046_00875 [Actinoplanes sp.]